VVKGSSPLSGIFFCTFLSIEKASENILIHCSGRTSQTIRRRADRTATMAGSFALNDTDTGGVILFGLLMGTRPL